MHISIHVYILLPKFYRAVLKNFIPDLRTLLKFYDAIKILDLTDGRVVTGV